MDPVTLGMAKADARRRDRDQARSGAVGQRIFGGRMGTFDNSTPNTFHVALETQLEYDGVRVIFANNNPAYSDNAVQVKVASLPSAADLNGNSATWVNCTKSGLLRITMPIAPATNRLRYVVSDTIQLSSVPRSDGGTKPILAIRAYMTNSSTLPVMGNGGSDNYANWATRTDGHLWCMRNQAGDHVTTPTTFTSTTNAIQSPIVGVQYLSRGRVVNVMVVGDSISEGRGTYINEGFGLLLADQLSSSSLAIEYSNCGWSGQGTMTYADRALDIIGSPIKPDVLLFPTGSPNNGTLNEALMSLHAWRRTQVVEYALDNGVTPVLWTMAPCNPTVHDWGSTDALRRADNARALTLHSRGILVADTATALSGTIDGDGQVPYAAGMTTDGIHPNDAGSAAMAQALRPYVAAAVGA